MSGENKKTKKLQLLGDLGYVKSVNDVAPDKEGNVKLEIPDAVALKPDVIIKPAIAEVGQTVIVKAVDEKGVPIEWEAADYHVVANDEEIMDMLTELEAIDPVTTSDGSVLISSDDEIYTL